MSIGSAAHVELAHGTKICKGLAVVIKKLHVGAEHSIAHVIQSWYFTCYAFELIDSGGCSTIIDNSIGNVMYEVEVMME